MFWASQFENYVTHVGYLVQGTCLRSNSFTECVAMQDFQYREQKFIAAILQCRTQAEDTC